MFAFVVVDACGSIRIDALDFRLWFFDLAGSLCSIRRP
jgi:hypothetical protein